MGGDCYITSGTIAKSYKLNHVDNIPPSCVQAEIGSRSNYYAVVFKVKQFDVYTDSSAERLLSTKKREIFSSHKIK